MFTSRTRYNQQQTQDHFSSSSSPSSSWSSPPPPPPPPPPTLNQQLPNNESHHTKQQSRSLSTCAARIHNNNATTTCNSSGISGVASSAAAAAAAGAIAAVATTNKKNIEDTAATTNTSTSTVNLAYACQKYIKFLQYMHVRDISTNITTLQERSLYRYHELWFPLLIDELLQRDYTGISSNASLPSSLDQSLQQPQLQQQQHNQLQSLLVPPPDVAWVWHCHRLSTSKYKSYILSIVATSKVKKNKTNLDNGNNSTSATAEEIMFLHNQILQEPRLPFDLVINEVSMKRWLARYPKEPFFLQQSQPQPQLQSQSVSASRTTATTTTMSGFSPPKHDRKHQQTQQEQSDPKQNASTTTTTATSTTSTPVILDASTIQKSKMIWNVVSSDSRYREINYIQYSIDCYYRFLNLKLHVQKTAAAATAAGSVSSDIIIPTFPIELIWMTHVLSSISVYDNDCIRMFGTTFHHTFDESKSLLQQERKQQQNQPMQKLTNRSSTTGTTKTTTTKSSTINNENKNEENNEQEIQSMYNRTAELWNQLYPVHYGIGGLVTTTTKTTSTTPKQVTWKKDESSYKVMDDNTSFQSSSHDDDCEGQQSIEIEAPFVADNVTGTDKEYDLEMKKQQTEQEQVKQEKQEKLERQEKQEEQKEQKEQEVHSTQSSDDGTTSTMHLSVESSSCSSSSIGTEEYLVVVDDNEDEVDGTTTPVERIGFHLLICISLSVVVMSMILVILTGANDLTNIKTNTDVWLFLVGIVLSLISLGYYCLSTRTNGTSTNSVSVIENMENYSTQTKVDAEDTTLQPRTSNMESDDEKEDDDDDSNNNNNNNNNNNVVVVVAFDKSDDSKNDSILPNKYSYQHCDEVVDGEYIALEDNDYDDVDDDNDSSNKIVPYPYHSANTNVHKNKKQLQENQQQEMDGNRNNKKGKKQFINYFCGIGHGGEIC